MFCRHVRQEHHYITTSVRSIIQILHTLRLEENRRERRERTISAKKENRDDRVDQMHNSSTTAKNLENRELSRVFVDRVVVSCMSAIKHILHTIIELQLRH